jgi:hypothetical protein
MTRTHESFTPPRAGSTISDPGIQGGAPQPSAPIPSTVEGHRSGSPASKGPANYLTGGFLVLDPGPPSAKASGEGSWARGITPIPGPLGEDASIRAELEGCYHMPEVSKPQANLPVGREGQDFGAPGAASLTPEEARAARRGGTPPASEIGKVHGGDEGPMPATPTSATSAGTTPTTPAPALTAGPKGDAYVVQPRFDNRPGQRVFDYRGFRPGG